MRKIEFRAKGFQELGAVEWRYASSFSELFDFFYGLDDGQLDSSTLEVYIGLKDKKGKKIWEKVKR